MEKHLPSVWDFGAKGDGLADDTAAFQAALDQGSAIFIPPGKFRITKELVFRYGSKLIGANVSQYPTAKHSMKKDSWLFYDGPLNRGGAFLRLSVAEVGVCPPPKFETSLFNVGVRSILVDGNAKIGIGMYLVRCGLQSMIEDVVVMGCMLHGLYGAKLYTTRMRNITAFNNLDRGITIGDNLYGWDNCYCNALVLDNISAYGCGLAGNHNIRTAPYAGAGLFLSLHRGNVVLSFTAEFNDGPGLVLAPTNGPNRILNGYVELNGYREAPGGGSAVQTGRAPDGYGIVVHGSAGALHNSIENVFLSGGSEKPQAVWLAGEEPSAGRPEGAFLLSQLFVGCKLIAEWANYRLIGCSKELASNIVGKQPICSGTPVAGRFVACTPQSARIIGHMIVRDADGKERKLAVLE